MNPAVNTRNQTSSLQPQQSVNSSALNNQSSNRTNIVATSFGGKEREGIKSKVEENIQAVSTEIEIPKEVEQAGVKKTHGEIVELPPDVKQLGVSPAGSFVPVSGSSSLPAVTLPISDQKVVVGLHAQITSGLRWLALWCVRKLGKAHIALKVIHGRVIRVKQKGS